jgi:hypothetical protein
VNVAGNKQVEPPVAVVVAKARAGGPVAQRDAGSFSHVGKGSVVVVVVQAVFAVVADVEIGPAVVVEVSHRHAKTPAVIGDARFLGHVGKGSVVVVMKERGARRLGLAVQRIEG